MTDLKPCPLCGSDADIRRSHDPDGCLWVNVKCRGCGCETRGKWVSHSSDTCPIFYAEVREEWNRRTPPEGMALVPREITAESGHKAGMIGDFEQYLEETCPDCDGEGWEDCELCEGSGQLATVVTVSWTTIKAIHRRAVEIAEGTES